MKPKRAVSKQTPNTPNIPLSAHFNENKAAIWICLFLAFATLAVYWPVVNNEFVNFDDNLYVYENADVKNGLTVDRFFRAFTTITAANWHPLTMLSHMLDVQIFGMKPGFHHLTSVVFHIANSLLLFLIFKQMTGELWQSAFLAALFALHPFHVESVAWISERKDVLSTLFWMLTIWSYSLWVKGPGIFRYAFVLLFFVMGLMAKPMVVTLPFVLLLLDWWPFSRIRFAGSSDESQCRPGIAFFRLVREKIPLFVITALSSVITFLAQKQGGAVSTLDAIPLQLRLANALVSYVNYMGKMIWPFKMAAFYPYPKVFQWWKITGACFLLIFISILVIKAVKRSPYVAVGWFWYLGTLFPVIGLVQVGRQSMADRYTYIPLIGLFIIVAWGVPELVTRIRNRKIWLSLPAAVVISILMLLTLRQVGYWKNSVSLYEHAIDVTVDNFFAHYNLGATLQDGNKLSDAIYHYSKSVQINPGFVKAHNNLGFVLAKSGRTRDAVRFFSNALKIKPDFAEAHNNLGLALAESGRLTEAVDHYAEALRIKPNWEDALNNMGDALVRQGRLPEAISYFSKALQINPDYAKAHNNMGRALEAHEKSTMAIDHYSKALVLDPDFAEAHYHLGNIMFEQGHAAEARAHYEKTLDIEPEFVPAINNLALIYALTSENDKALSLFKRLVSHQPDQTEIYYNIACIYARQDNKNEAIDWLQKAIERGYTNWDLIKTDPDLESIRGSLLYKNMIEGR